MPEDENDTDKIKAHEKVIFQEKSATLHDKELQKNANHKHSEDHNREEEESIEENKEIKHAALEKTIVLTAMGLVFVATVVTGGIAPLIIAGAAATLNFLVVPLKMKIDAKIRGKHRKMVKTTIATNTTRRTIEISASFSEAGKHAFVFSACAAVFNVIALPLAAFVLVASVISFATAIIAYKKNPSFAAKCAVTGTFFTMAASGTAVGLMIAGAIAGTALMANPITAPILAAVIVGGSIVKAAPFIHKFFKNIIAPKFKSWFKRKPKPTVNENNLDINRKKLENDLNNKKKKTIDEKLSDRDINTRTFKEKSGPNPTPKSNLVSTATNVVPRPNVSLTPNVPNTATVPNTAPATNSRNSHPIPVPNSAPAINSYNTVKISAPSIELSLADKLKSELEALDDRAKIVSPKPTSCISSPVPIGEIKDKRREEDGPDLIEKKDRDRKEFTVIAEAISEAEQNHVGLSETPSSKRKKTDKEIDVLQRNIEEISRHGKQKTSLQEIAKEQPEKQKSHRSTPSSSEHL